MSSDDNVSDAPVEGRSRGELSGLRRRIVLTYRHHGPRSVLLRAITFPLRFTPVRSHLPFGLDSSPERRGAMRWYRDHGRPVTIVIPSTHNAAQVRRVVASIRRTADLSRVRIIVADAASGPAHVAALRQIRGIHVVEGPEKDGFAASVNRALAVAGEGTDVVILGADVVPHRGWLAALQWAAAHGTRAGIVGPKLVYPDGRIKSAGIERNPRAPNSFVHRYRGKPPNWGPATVAQPALAVAGACMYFTRAALERIGHLDGASGLGDLDVDVCLRAWAAGLRVLYAPAAVLQHEAPVTDGMSVDKPERSGEFFDRRDVQTPDRALRVIYVTQDTSVGGGHRDVFEHLNGLHAHGHQAELWCLGGPPNWFDLRVPVQSFGDYEELTSALAPLDAIKVATWWQTAGPVWEASITRGIPVYLVQDIETSYYPDDQRNRHAVVASYRSEFHYLTISAWNRDQLARLGLDATLIPPGVDLTTFRPNRDITRQPDTILAVGRSNPLKNFPLTLSAWRSLKQPRPELRLFGVEPEVAGDEPGIRYVTAPSDHQISELLAEATMFVQTSSHEGFCLPLLEAMAAGCPVICTDAHGNRDFCEHEINCLMVAPTRSAVASAIARLLEDQALRERLSSAGPETAARYAWPPRIDQLEAFFRALAEVHDGRPPNESEQRPGPRREGGAVPAEGRPW